MIAQFALRLLCGISLMWVLMPRARITAGFFRIQMLVALGLGVLATATVGHLSPVNTGASTADSPILTQLQGRMLCALLAALAYAGSVVWTLGRRRAGVWFVHAIAGLSWATLVGTSIGRESWNTDAGLLTIVSETVTSLVLGGATGGMLLGHWYLTAPTMSIDPLRRVNACFAVSVMLRMAASLAGLWLAWPLPAQGTALLWLVLRWLAGIVAPLILTAMVWRILKYKNTQAATGVLFVGVIVTFIGELSATLASRELHFPL